MNGKLVVIVAGALLFSGSVVAKDMLSKDVAKCAVIEGDLARLECFDTLAKQHKINGPQNQPVDNSNSGKWVTSVDINPVDDSKTVTIFNDATSGTNRYGEGISLIIRCKSDKTEFYVSWQSYLGSDVSVLSRVGSSKAETAEWDVSTDKKATFHPNPIPFIKSLLISDKLVLQVTPYNENPVTAVFDTTGLSNAIKPLRETCKW